MGGGENVEILGSFGRQPGQFMKPRAIEFTREGHVIVIDRTGRVQRIDPRTGDIHARWTLELHENGTPTGMKIDPRDGTVWIADTHYQRILQYDQDGNLLFSFGEEGSGPGQMIFPTDVQPDPHDGTLWVVEYGLRSRVMHFTAEGEFIKEWGSEEFEYSVLDRPMALTLDSEGRIFIVDAVNHRVVVYNRDGELLWTFGEPGREPGKMRYPYDLAVGEDGMLYVCEYGNSRISRWTPEGEFLGVWGTVGFGAGQLASPWGVAYDGSSRLAIADTLNERIQIIDRPARHFSIPAGRS